MSLASSILAIVFGGGLCWLGEIAAFGAGQTPLPALTFAFGLVLLVSGVALVWIGVTVQSG